MKGIREKRMIKEYLPRQVRDPSVPYEETEFDRALLGLLAEHHMLMVEHLAALTGGNLVRIRRRLKLMFHNGYVGRVWPREPLYYLERRGVEAIAPYMSAEVVAGKPEHPVHDLMIANFHVCLSLALRELDDASLESISFSRLHYRNNINKIKRILPDRLFIVGYEDTELLFSLEANHQLRLDPFLLKLKTYWTYVVEQKRQREELGFDGLRVLNIAKTEVKKENLRRKAKEADPDKRGSEMFWFTSEERYGLERPGAILGPIWQTPRDDTWHSLLE